jgi:hypothetical protein
MNIDCTIRRIEGGWRCTFADGTVIQAERLAEIEEMLDYAEQLQRADNEQADEN